ncbi:hypothetical protein, partial [Streptomyces herbicida]|uniref:hypothetical protein n=1 Tax=Streptomyces herbicida TaxID=3065675 RepID=UPI00292EA87A
EETPVSAPRPRPDPTVAHLMTSVDLLLAHHNNDQIAPKLPVLKLTSPFRSGTAAVEAENTKVLS